MYDRRRLTNTSLIYSTKEKGNKLNRKEERKPNKIVIIRLVYIEFYFIMQSTIAFENDISNKKAKGVIYVEICW